MSCGGLMSTATFKHLDGNLYLLSSGNVRQYPRKIEDQSGKSIKDLRGATEELLCVEEYEWTSSDENQTLLQPQEVKTALLEFHIVYHTIYQTPVLYFRASSVEGLPLPSEVFTHDVEFPGSNGWSKFVAVEEHPVLGKLFSFLHPCETAAAMQLLQAQVENDGSTKSLLDTEVPWYLTSWLSLVQPLTCISPLEYYSV